VGHPEVYAPAEDTRFLAQSMPGVSGPCADVGTGSGLLAMAMAAAGASVVATDVNPHAVRAARENARANALEVSVIRADLLRGVRGRFRHVAFNPPYLPGGRAGAWVERAWVDDGAATRFLGLTPGWLLPGGEVHILLRADDRASAEVVEGRYEVLRRASRRLFFEELCALTLRPRD
jgi:release factor glutamine methyltransferase